MTFEKNDIFGIENAIDRYLYRDYDYETEYSEEISAERGQQRFKKCSTESR